MTPRSHHNLSSRLKKIAFHIMKGYFFFLLFLNSLFLMCISFPTNTLSMSDEVIKFVIIEKQQSCDSAVSPGSLAHRRKAWGSPAGMKKKKKKIQG